jgi:hypothetical protein
MKQREALPGSHEFFWKDRENDEENSFDGCSKHVPNIQRRGTEHVRFSIRRRLGTDGRLDDAGRPFQSKKPNREIGIRQRILTRRTRFGKLGSIRAERQFGAKRKLRTKRLGLIDAE